MKIHKVAFSLLLLAFISCKQDSKKMASVNEFKRDNAMINYNIYGDGGNTLLFVHGAYMDQTYWNEQVKFFSPDYKVVTMDLPGHGKSGKGRLEWSVEGFAYDVSAIIRKLELKNVILVGHSLAGDINLIAATSRPKNIIGFIAIDDFKDAATKPSKALKKQTDAILKKLKKDFPGTNEQYARKALLTEQTPPEITEKVVSAFRNAYQPMGEEIMPQVFQLYKTEQKLLPQLKLKLHLINVNYILTKEARLKEYAGKGYEIQHMQGTCHYPMLENPKELNRLLQNAIDEISRENDAVYRHENIQSHS